MMEAAGAGAAHCGTCCPIAANHHPARAMLQLKNESLTQIRRTQLDGEAAGKLIVRRRNGGIVNWVYHLVNGLYSIKRNKNVFNSVLISILILSNPLEECVVHLNSSYLGCNIEVGYFSVASLNS